MRASRRISRPAWFYPSLITRPSIRHMARACVKRRATYLLPPVFMRGPASTAIAAPLRSCLVKLQREARRHSPSSRHRKYTRSSAENSGNGSRSAALVTPHLGKMTPSSPIAFCVFVLCSVVLSCWCSSLRSERSARSAPAQKQLVQLVHAQQHPGGPAMIALAAALRALHVAQQGIHLGQGEPAVRAHRGLAGLGRDQMVEVLVNARAIAVQVEIGKHVAQQLRRVAVGKQGGQLANDQCLRPDTSYIEAELVQQDLMFLYEPRLLLAHRRGERQ